ncbi:MAG TPA: isoleucine--tRNA ligase [Candidatus Babeliales bacterium]|nr:isoleucine--tRNA ligase [Candidatus Babeliales bacterium]
MESKNDKSKSDLNVSFKDTLNLPHTDFPIRPQATETDPQLLERWDRENLYQESFNIHSDSEKFILHDGPPYANGHIHLGHAYNKILKDIITKSQRMSGKHVPVTPGWDCHGLPIELKVTQENPDLEPVDLKKKCREYAQGWIDVQRSEFKKLGVLMNWDHPYITMDYNYESSIMKAFGICFEKGFIERKKKTVPWCPSCQTVLAAAEIEYHDRKDPSIYVRFPLPQHSLNNYFPELFEKTSGKEVSLLVWTTTPWTLPLNRAVCLKPDTDYSVIELNGHYVIVALSLVDSIYDLISDDKNNRNILMTFGANRLTGGKVNHPFIKNLTVPILLEPFVSTQDGTACVHSAPGCGPEDYEIGVRNNLEIYSPISPDGKYTKGIEPESLENMSVADGQGWVLKTMSDNNSLMFKKSISHSYPHCWRCHGGLIFRATNQWFLNLAKNNLRQQALQAIEDIRFIPKASSGFLKATVSGRLEWCISRQRIWGVPIPAFLCKACDYGFTSQDIIAKAAEGVAKEGVEFWDKVTLDALASDKIICPACSSDNIVKEHDILDVWFDSGVSHFAVLSHNKDLGYPADIYLEGVDQHRGWFQSSLLTSLILHEAACTKSIVTHGFTVDAQGRKMSKSLGNVIPPEDLIHKLGTDGLRLWASSIDVEGDAIVSPVLLANVQEVYRKIRNTCRFLLSNLYDFNAEKDSVKINDMYMLDRYALAQLTLFQERVEKAYQEVAFTDVFHYFADYCTTELSSFYLDIIKDRLYTDYPSDQKRRSAQTACYIILDTLTRLMAPILSFTSELISDHYQKPKNCSIHLQLFADHSELKRNLGDAHEIISQWEDIKKIRSVVLKKLEELRQQGIIKHSLEAQVKIALHTKGTPMLLAEDIKQQLTHTNQSIEEFLKELLIVSQVHYDEYGDIEDYDDFDDEDDQENDESFIEDDQDMVIMDDKGIIVEVDKAQGDKCPRCWQWEATDHELRLCTRCQQVVARLRNKS